jgi:hypothetical protein
MQQQWPLMLVLSATGVACYNTMAYIGLTGTTAVDHDPREHPDVAGVTPEMFGGSTRPHHCNAPSPRLSGRGQNDDEDNRGITQHGRLRAAGS